MTRKIIKYCSVCLLLAVAFSCNSSSPNGFKIKGNIQGLPDGTVMELVPAATHKEEKAIASAVVAGGKFEFQGNVEGPRLFHIVVSGKNTFGSMPVMVEPAKITLTATVSHEKNDGYTNYKFSEVDIKGSPVHLEYVKKSLEPREALDQLYQDYHMENKEILDAMSEARGSKDEERLKELYASDAWKKLAEDERTFFKTVATNIETMIADNSDTWWGPFLIMDQMSYLSKEQETWWNKLSDEAKNSYYGQLVKAELFPKDFVGEKATDFTVVDKDGKDVSLSDYTGKYLIIDFWGSWCNPCRKSHPHLVELYNKYKGDNFDILGLAGNDKDHEKWLTAIKEDGLVWRHANLEENKAKQDVGSLFNIKAYPTKVLIDPNGIVLAYCVGNSEPIDEKLKEIFGK